MRFDHLLNAGLEVNTKSNAMHGFIYMKCPEHTNPWKKKQVSGSQGLRGSGEWEEAAKGTRVSGIRLR